jgi:hypothetical protein
VGRTVQLILAQPKELRMWIRHATALVGLLGALSTAAADDFRIEEVDAARSVNPAQLKPGSIAFSDREAGTGSDEAANLIGFAQWARTHPNERKFLSLYPAYTEPTITKTASASTKAASAGPVVQKLTMYVAQARFVVDRPPGAIDLSRYVTLNFLEKVDPAIKHKLIAAADLPPLKDQQGLGNDDPDRKWCTGRTTLICIESSYKLEGRIPMGIMLVNKLRDSAKKVSDHIDFDSELSQLTPADLDQAALKQLTGLDTAVFGALEQNIFYVNQIMKFGKFFAVFQTDPADANKTAVTAFMALAIDSGVLAKKKEFENVPVLRNLVPAQVLMGQSSFNSGESISAGLPQYARNEIRTIADLLNAR